MGELIVKIEGSIEKIKATSIFNSRNPKTKRHNVNLYDTEEKWQKWVQLFCENEEEARTLAEDIREGKISDLTGYLAERRL